MTDGQKKPFKLEGAYPFITKLTFGYGDNNAHAWESRLFRKGITTEIKLDFKSVRKSLWSGLAKVASLNWWISILFAVGSGLFILGSVFSLWKDIAEYFKLEPEQVNLIFFLGSIPFTSAAFLQLLQAILANRKMGKSIEFFNKSKGLNHASLGFLSALLQFAGTLLFNVNTFEAMRVNLDNMQTEILVWLPEFMGSILFLVSGYFAFMEVIHCYWKWETQRISWWVVFINLLGCIAFMISAMLAASQGERASDMFVSLSLIFLLIGAICFLVGSLLMLPEMGDSKRKANKHCLILLD